MRRLLPIGFAALVLSFSGLSASAATLGEVARSSNTEWVALAQRAPSLDGREPNYVRDANAATVAGSRDRSQESLVDDVEAVAAVAGAGLLVTLAAVGLRRVWTQDPIRDPLGEGPGFL